MKTKQLILGIVLAITAVTASAQHRGGFNSGAHSYSNRSVTVNNYGGYHGGYRGGYYGGGCWGCGVGAAIVGGAIIGGAIANSYAYPYYAPAPVYVAPPVYAAPQPTSHYEQVWVPSCGCYQNVLVRN